jgi:hypothetical protein
MQTLLRNNREFQRLGLGQFRVIMNACVPMGAAKPTDAVSENSGSLYQPGDEDREQEAVDKAYVLFHYLYSFVFNMQKLFIFFNFLCAGGSPGFGA